MFHNQIKLNAFSNFFIIEILYVFLYSAQIHKKMGLHLILHSGLRTECDTILTPRNPVFLFHAVLNT